MHIAAAKLQIERHSPKRRREGDYEYGLELNVDPVRGVTVNAVKELGFRSEKGRGKITMQYAHNVNGGSCLSVIYLKY